MMNTALAIAFLSTTQAFNLPPGLLSALCFVESNHKVHVVNVHDGGSSSYGVCQIKQETAEMVGYEGTPQALRKPSVNVYYAGKYLRHQMDRYDNDLRKAISAYNAGSHKENSRGLTMNRKYVSKVFKAWSQDR